MQISIYSVSNVCEKRRTNRLVQLPFQQKFINANEILQSYCVQLHGFSPVSMSLIRSTLLSTLLSTSPLIPSFMYHAAIGGEADAAPAVWIDPGTEIEGGHVTVRRPEQRVRARAAQTALWVVVAALALDTRPTATTRSHTNARSWFRNHLLIVCKRFKAVNVFNCDN